MIRRLFTALALIAVCGAPFAPTAQAAERVAFPDGFVWGTATAAVQCEGGTVASDWERFSARPGAIRDGHRIGDAARHWALYEEDFAAAAAMHTNGYRFSIEWSRLVPAPGVWDAGAAAHYRRMLESLTAKGIRPMVTLHHFSNPQWVADRGGWRHPETPALFAEFARRAALAYGDLVDEWVTFNEPTVYAGEGYMRGYFPPGIQGNLPAALQALDRMAEAHRASYKALHEADRVAAAPGAPACRVGIAEHMVDFHPAAPWNPLDHVVAALSDHLLNRRFLDAAEGRLDFVGVNYYTRSMASALAPFARTAAPGSPVTELGLEIHPQGLGRVLDATYRRYGKPIVITETGISDSTRRETPAFMVAHVAEVGRAIARGIPVRGLYWWSLMDNFEWQNGYHGRFGLLEVDFEDPARPRKWTPAAHLYARIARLNGLSAGGPHAPTTLQRPAGAVGAQATTAELRPWLVAFAKRWVGFFDKDGDGRVSRAEFTGANVNWPNNHAFNQFSQDGDDYLTLEELTSDRAIARRVEDFRGSGYSYITYLDRDEDRKVSLDELLNHKQFELRPDPANAKPDPAFAKVAFAKADKDKDGKMSRGEVELFVVFCIGSGYRTLAWSQPQDGL